MRSFCVIDSELKVKENYLEIIKSFSTIFRFAQIANENFSKKLLQQNKRR